ncbi:MAG TPA: beta-galactosidase [Balneolaceae bacterium]|nr:beta-galactosidase [Balneolaceae bacterium]
MMGGKPYQIISGELHFQRIPVAYWKDRLQEAKAMGLNTIATYIFWNRIEPKRGEWNFSGRNDLRKFIKLAQQVGLNVLLRPGPYSCGEWSFGGLPPWLLNIPHIKVRSSNPQYMKAVKSYEAAVSRQIKGLQNPDGPIIMVQIENEYGSYGDDKSYLKQLAAWWRKDGIHVPFYTADGAAKSNLEAGGIPGAAVGLDPGTSQKQFDLASKIRPNVPIFCSEYYPGWLTHWRDKKWAHVDTTRIVKDINWFMQHHKSFNLYMFNGGTNFGFTAGANYSDHYEPDVTSYDYDAPLNEMGEPTPKYYAIRRAISKHLPNSKKPPAVPAHPAVTTIPPIQFNQKTSIWDHLPKPKDVAQPRPMEAFGQNHGYTLYRTKLLGVTHGKLRIFDLHDFATVFLDGKFIGTIDRSLGQSSIKIPQIDDPHPTLDILVEAMGRINFGPRIIDRKGITHRVQLGYMTLMNWQVYNIPMQSSWVQNLSFRAQTSVSRPGTFFKAHFNLQKTGSTYLDMSKWKKGFVWVNGHNLGRYWDVGPQQRLYCPGAWLHKGKNTIVVFDMLKKNPSTVAGKKQLE